jgi:hypothetical protein
MDDTTALLEQATVLLAAVAGRPVAGVTDEQLCSLIVAAEEAGRFVDAVRVVTAAEVDERSRFALGKDGLSYRLGHRRAGELVEQLTRVSAATAADRIRVGTAIRAEVTFDGQVLPARHRFVGDAVVTGSLGMDAARAIFQNLDVAAKHSLLPEQFDPTEAYLVGIGQVRSADLVAVEARVMRAVLDPDGAPQRDEDLRERRRFTLGRESHGMTTFSGACDPVSAGLLRAAFAESLAPDATPRFMTDEDRATAVAAEVKDARTNEQRHHDVLFGLITAGVRAGATPGTPRSTASVNVVVRLSDLQTGRGVGWIDDIDEPISVATVQELICDAGMRRALVGDNDQPLALGELERYFTTHQRRALGIRDGGCVWPHCTAPPSWCHAHHVLEWEHGGQTDINNGVLLCPAHHHMLHASPFTMRIHQGRPQLLAPPWIDPAQNWNTIGRARTTEPRVPSMA